MISVINYNNFDNLMLNYKEMKSRNLMVEGTGFGPTLLMILGSTKM
jgi:hypothetical protein